MTRLMTLAWACTVLIGVLSAGGAFAQQGAGGDLSPGKSNCASSTGCANYPTGDVTKQNPAAKPSNSIGSGGDLSPAKSNCGPNNQTCANYATGDMTKTNPANPQGK